MKKIQTPWILSVRTAFISLSLVVLVLCSTGAASDEGLHRFGKRMEIDRGLVVKACAETTLRSIEISLQEAKHSELADWLKHQNPPASLPGTTLKDFASELGKHLLRVLPADRSAADRRSIAAALERSRGFLRLDSRPIEETLPLPGARLPFATFTHEIDDYSSCMGEVRWPGVASYAEDRLGPLIEMIQRLIPEDRVVLTNLQESDLYKTFPRLTSIRRFHLPLSSYGKVITLLTQPDGRRNLVLSGFDSRSYLIHFGLLISRFRQDRGLQFSIVERFDPIRLREAYEQLLIFAREQPASFGSLDALVVGYPSEFHRLWKDYRTAEVIQKGFLGENWELSVFRFPEGGTVGVLGGDVDFYGESLARQLERLMTFFPVKTIFFGGSGGATIPRPRYELYYPTFIRSPRGLTARNILTGSDDAGFHVSVDSPLFESPLRLSRFQMEHCHTVDMEAGHLADLATKFGIKLGVGILITDFPTEFGSMGITLGEQNFRAKIASREDFVRKVEGAVRRGEKTWLHPIEQFAGRSVLGISHENLERTRQTLGSFSAEEQEILRRFHTLPFRIVIRMSPGRLYWTLKDGALFSTGLLRALGQETTPFTPDLENDMFGAFDYVFASYAKDLGQRMYGDVVLLLKPEEVLPRSWATRVSGWRVAEQQGGRGLGEQKKAFIREIFHPDHFREAIDLQTVIRLRSMARSEREKLLARPTVTWPHLFYELDFGRLELKIKSHVLCREIERVLLPPAARGDIPAMLRARGIPFTYYSPGFPVVEASK